MHTTAINITAKIVAFFFIMIISFFAILLPNVLGSFIIFSSVLIFVCLPVPFFLLATFFKYALKFFLGRKYFQKFRLHFVSSLVNGNSHRLAEVLHDIFCVCPVRFLAENKAKVGNSSVATDEL